MRPPSALFLLLLLPVVAAAGSGTADSLRTVLTVTTDRDSVPVMVNGTPVGSTPVNVDTLPAGTYVVSVQQTTSESWFAGTRSDTVVLAEGSITRVNATVWRYLHLVSEPAGVPVFADDSLLGSTPLLMRRGLLDGNRSVMLRPTGVPPIQVRLADARAGIIQYRLPPESVSDDGREVSLLRDDRGLPTRVYVAAAAAIISGVAAAICKVEADEVYAGYRTSRDPAARDRTRRLDTAAAAALTAMQINLGLFVYFIVSE